MPPDKSSSSKRHSSQNSPTKAKPTTPTKLNKAWSPREDLALLREVLEAGEKNVDWHTALSRVNAQGAAVQNCSSSTFGDRSMASVRGHWAQSLRPRLELTLDRSAQDVKYGSPRRKSSKGDCD